MVASLRLTPFALWLALTGACTEDPFDFGGPRSCALADQNEWVRDLMEQAYLWREELPAVEPRDFDGPAEVVAALRVDPDRWSRVSDRTRTDKLFKEGQTLSFGYRTARGDDGELIVAWVADGSAADRAGIRRGDRLVSLQGDSIANIDAEDRWGEIYGEDVPGARLDVTVARGKDQQLDSTLIKDWYAIETVPVAKVLEYGRTKMGYLLFATFVDPATDRLDEVFASFVDAGVHDLIVDLRYNGGGKVDVARYLLDLIVGDVADGRPGYKVRYGSGLRDQDVTRPLERRAHSISTPRRIVFITTGATLSASELVINGVRPYADVRVVGQTTGGKPVGAHQWGFCDSVVAPITFRLLNAEDQGDYFDGFAPDCAAEDDLSHALGDPNEAALAQAIAQVVTGECANASQPESQAQTDPDAAEFQWGLPAEAFFGTWDLAAPGHE